MKNSILWILVTVPVQAILGFFLAYAIEERIRSKKADGKSFSRTFYRTLFFIPVVTSVTVVAIMFSRFSSHIRESSDIISAHGLVCHLLLMFLVIRKLLSGALCLQISGSGQDGL